MTAYSKFRFWLGLHPSQGSSRDIQLDLIGLLDFNINYKMQLFVKLLTELPGNPAD